MPSSTPPSFAFRRAWEDTLFAAMPELGPDRFALLYALGRCADRDTGADCFPGVSYLVRTTKISQRQVYRLLSELEEGGWFKRINGKFKSTLYILNPSNDCHGDTHHATVTPTLPAWQGGLPPRQGGLPNETPTPATVAPYYSYNYSSYCSQENESTPLAASFAGEREADKPSPKAPTPPPLESEEILGAREELTEKCANALLREFKAVGRDRVSWGRCFEAARKIVGSGEPKATLQVWVEEAFDDMGRSAMSDAGILTKLTSDLDTLMPALTRRLAAEPALKAPTTPVAPMYEGDGDDGLRALRKRVEAEAAADRAKDAERLAQVRAAAEQKRIADAEYEAWRAEFLARTQRAEVMA